MPQKGNLHLYTPQPLGQQYNQFGTQNQSTTTTTTTTTTNTSQSYNQQEDEKYAEQESITGQQSRQAHQVPPAPPVPIQKQPPPPPQTVLQPAQLTQNVQQRFDYTQLANAPAAPSAPQSAFDYTKLASTPVQQSTDIAATTTTQTTTTKTQREQKARREEKKNQQNTVIASTDAGGQARQAAASKGKVELRRFDQQVQQMLLSVSSAACYVGFPYYPGRDGYLCGGGSHFVSHDDVDNMLKYNTPPRVQHVNIIDDPRVTEVAPPPDGWHEPMHWSPEQRVLNGMLLMPLKHDGSRWKLSPHVQQWIEISSAYFD